MLASLSNIRYIIVDYGAEAQYPSVGDLKRMCRPIWSTPNPVARGDAALGRGRGSAQPGALRRSALAEAGAVDAEWGSLLLGGSDAVRSGPMARRMVARRSGGSERTADAHGDIHVASPTAVGVPGHPAPVLPRNWPGLGDVVEPGTEEKRDETCGV